MSDLKVPMTDAGAELHFYILGVLTAAVPDRQRTTILESIRRYTLAIEEQAIAIEEQAIAIERARIADAYRGLRGYPSVGPGSGDEVLAIIERRGRYWDGVLRPVES